MLSVITADPNRMPRVFLLMCSLLLTQSACSEAPATSLTVIQPRSPDIAFTGDTLKVLSLNVAHGRKDRMNQLLLSGNTIRKNLADIATFLARTGADIVALQEADAASRWSGNFDHVALLAEQAGYPVFSHTPHASSWLFSYGTAILSQAAFTETINYTFEPSPPTMNKGFTLAQIVWQPDANDEPLLPIDVISVHLDFSRQEVRESQIQEITRALGDRDNPVIVLGDFNSDWLADELVVRSLADDNKLKGYRPEDNSLGTYKSGENSKRLDWILISSPLEFVSYEVLPDVVSDHKAVLAEIALEPEPLADGVHTDHTPLARHQQ